MTTVINFSIFNYVKLRLTKLTFNDNRVVNMQGIGEDAPRADAQVIDVTPFSRAHEDGEMKRVRGIDHHRSAQRLLPHSGGNAIYDRRGRVIACSQDKGTNISSYV